MSDKKVKLTEKEKNDNIRIGLSRRKFIIISEWTCLMLLQQFPLQNDLTYSNYYKLPKIVYDENFNSLILQQKIYLRKTNNINMLDFRFVNLFKQNTVISTG